MKAMDIGTITISGIQPGMKIGDASQHVGPLFPSVRDDSDDCDKSFVHYVTEHVPDLKVFAAKDSETIELIHGGSIELDGTKLLSLGDTSSSLEKKLGKVADKGGWSRQIWTYHDVGENRVGLNFTLDEGRIIGISTVNKVALRAFEAAKKEEDSHRNNDT
jgi:hypothetical protein